MADYNIKKQVICVSEFNPSKREKTVISIRIPTFMLGKIDDLSADRDISRNEFILQCIDFAFAHLPGEKKNRDADIDNSK